MSRFQLIAIEPPSFHISQFTEATYTHVAANPQCSHAHGDTLLLHLVGLGSDLNRVRPVTVYESNNCLATDAYVAQVCDTNEK
jgi:hypothetical protein